MNVFINEIHYDNAGTDAGEFIELAGLPGTSLDGWSVVLYNGANGMRYGTIDLTGQSLLDDGSGLGVFVLDLPTNGLQNGSPDGIALVDDSGTVIQFLSYEGTLTAVDGAAAGMTSTDIGVAENGSAPVGFSLQLTGTGMIAADFTWSPEQVATKGTVNTGQTYTGTVLPYGGVVINEFVATTVGTDWEFVELFGAAGTSLDGLSLIVVEGDIGSAFGTIDSRFDFDASHEIGENGFFLLTSPQAEAIFGITGNDSIPNNFLENSSFTLALVETASLTDTNLNLFTPVVIDAVGVTDGGVGDVFYLGAPVVGPDGSFMPAGATRIVDGADSDTASDWALLDFNDSSSATPTVGGGDEPPPPPVPLLPISQIQGSGDTSPLVGQKVTVSAVVVATEARGFWLQEEATDEDGNAATSEGIYVFTGTAPSVAEGDLVTVTGTVDEFFSQTQIQDVTSVEVQASGQYGLISIAEISADPVTLSFEMGAFEAVEGMVVRFLDDLTVTQLFNYERFGELQLSVAGLQYQFTQLYAPDPDAYAAWQETIYSQRIILDDGLSTQNPDTLPFDTLNDGLSAGDVFENLTGVMTYSFGAYKLIPTEANPIVLTDAQQPQETPDDVGGRLQVATFNVLNYFLTLDTFANAGSVQGLDPRGANSAAELEIQTQKIVASLAAMDADVIGLVEIENDADDAAVSNLVARLNEETGRNYQYVPTGTIGKDAIKVAMIYDADTVEIANGGTAIAVLATPEFVDPLDSGQDRNRPALAVSFVEIATDETFTVVNNHLKSKGSAVPGDPDLNDGQGNGALTRLLAAEALTDWLATDPTGVGDEDYVIIGDLNSYAQEDPIAALEDAGYVNMLAAYEGLEAYSYRFSGQWGTLDYVMANETLAAQSTGATVWNANSEAVSYLDYNDNIRDQNEASFNVKPPSLWAEVDPTSPIASSDHDAVIIGLNLFTADPSLTLDKRTVNANGIGGDGIGVLAGGTVGWVYTVENTGNVDLVDVSVVDSDAAIGELDPADAGVTLVESMAADGVLEIGETWTYTVTGTAIAITDGNYATYENTAIATGYHTDAVERLLSAEDSDGSSYVALAPGYLLSGGHEDFGDVFRAIFTPKPSDAGLEYKLSATNPGQFRYDILAEDLGDAPLVIEVPYPFVTQGMMTVEWYDSVDVVLDPDSGALTLLPGAVAGSVAVEIDLDDYGPAAGFGDTVEILLDPEALGIDDGFVMLSTHLDFGLKGTTGWGFGDEDAKAPTGFEDLLEGESFVFSSSVAGSSDTVRIDNDFKAIRGLGGMLTAEDGAPLGGESIQLIVNGSIQTVETDDDGWWFLGSKTGKLTVYGAIWDRDGNGIDSGDIDLYTGETVGADGPELFALGRGNKLAILDYQEPDALPVTSAFEQFPFVGS